MAGIISKVVGKNLSVKQERTIIALLIISAVVIYGYFAPQCWFYQLWGIGYGPAVCQITSGGFASGGTSESGGTCGTCTVSGGTCDCPEASCETCNPPAGRLPCGMNGDEATCGGYCPYLYTCQSLRFLIGDGSDYGYCACIPTTGFDLPDDRPDDYCYLAGARVCGGGCESQYETCTYDAKYEDCYCVSNVN